VRGEPSAGLETCATAGLETCATGAVSKCTLKPVHRISDFVRELKKAASNSQICAEQFYWQDGYSIFSVGPESLSPIADYIERQEEHHRQESFEEELKQLLEKHGTEYDPKYLL
jgi:hypothetical protein